MHVKVLNGTFLVCRWGQTWFMNFFIISLITWHSILQPHQNSVILHAFMDLFCSFVRVNLFSEKASQLSYMFSQSMLWIPTPKIHFYVITFICLCICILVFLLQCNWCFHIRCQGRCCCKCITFCMPCQEMTETLIIIIGKNFVAAFFLF